MAPAASRAAFAPGGTGAFSGALFDPRAPGAIVLNAAQWADGAGVLQGGKPVVRSKHAPLQQQLD